MYEIICVRIGQTENNAKRIISGCKPESDSPFTETGVRMAQQVGNLLRGIRISAIYTGSAKRCQETARYTAMHHNMQPIVCEVLDELDFGDFDGQSYDSLQNDEWARKFFSDPTKCEPYGMARGASESIPTRQRRLRNTIDTLVKKHGEDGSICIFTHEGTVRAIIGALLGIDLAHFWQFEQGNCAVTVFRTDGNGAYQLSELIQRPEDGGLLRGLLQIK